MPPTPSFHGNGIPSVDIPLEGTFRLMERATPRECIPAMGYLCGACEGFFVFNVSSASIGSIGCLRGVRFRLMYVLRIPCQNTSQNEVVSLRNFPLGKPRCCFLG